MHKRPAVSLLRYEEPLRSVKAAVEKCGGLERLPFNARIFVKPNIVYWTSAVPFPKYGVVTTSRVVEDMVILLKDFGVNSIIIGEGTVTLRSGDKKTTPHAFESLGYREFERRYGTKTLNVFERPFVRVALDQEIDLNFNRDILESDFVVNLPVLKTHGQTVVSLGIKNLKGVIDVASRKKCHSVDSDRDLNFMIARLPQVFPPIFTLIDGIYSLERGPGFDGTARRSNLLIASSDILCADMIGAKILGYEPSEVPHLVQATLIRNGPKDISGIKVVGESVQSLATHHEFSFPYNQKHDLPIALENMGIKGLSYRKYDLTLCTYCSQINSIILPAIVKAWGGEPWDDVEILTGKIMKPTTGKKRVVLIGKCICEANRDNPEFHKMIAVKGCPPNPKGIYTALLKVGIDVNSAFFDRIEEYPGKSMKRYENKPGFDDSFFRPGALNGLHVR